MKILFFKTKYLCYDSNSVFINEMSKSFRKYGVEVDVCEVLEEERAAEVLEQYCGKKYDACIDFNAVTPRAEFDDGTRFLDTIDAPFFNYIVDHPFYHHPILNIPLKNSHVLCLDEHHVDYIRRHYPHIKSAHFLPLGAMKGLVDVPYEKKNIDILFTGTYYMTDEVYRKQIRQYPEDWQKDMMAIIDIMLSNQNLTMEQALSMILKDSGREVSDTDFAKIMNRYYQAEFYVRAHNRHNLVESIIKAGIPLTIMGNKWEEFRSPYSKYLTIKEPIGYALSIEMNLHAKMILNILPNFKAGIHDRVLTAMVNKSISVTDTSTYLQNHFEDEKDIVYYQLEQLDLLPEKILKIQKDISLAEKISESGYQKVVDRFSWDRRVEEFLDILKGLKNRK